MTEDPEEHLPEVEEQDDTLNLTDKIKLRSQRKRVDNEADQAAKFWREIFATTIGRRELWKLLQASQPDGDVFTPPFACGPNGFPQPEATWMRAGQYALGQHIWRYWLEHAPDGAVLMLEEHDRRIAAARKRSRKSG